MTAPTIQHAAASPPGRPPGTSPVFDIIARDGRSGTVLACRACEAVFAVQDGAVTPDPGDAALHLDGNVPDPGDLSGGIVDCAGCPARGVVAHAGPVGNSRPPHVAARM